MEHNEVDVTYSVKASESNGRRLIKNIDTGETRWEGGEEVKEPAKEVKEPAKELSPKGKK